ncbi:MAG: SRPBCC family protein [Bacteroidota bacterium]
MTPNFFNGNDHEGQSAKQSPMTINQAAPVVQKKEIIIHAVPEKVWQILTNIESWDDWNKRIKDPKLQSALAVGGRFIWKTNGSKIKSAIHSFAPNHFFGWQGKAFGATAIHNWYLAPTKNGTKVRVEESMEGWIIRLMKKKMNEKLAADMVYWLERLKEESEK